MNIIANKKLDFTASFMLGLNQEAHLHAFLPGGNVRRIVVKCVPIGVDGLRTANYHHDSEKTVVTLTGWDNPLGMAIPEPEYFNLDAEGKKIYYQIAQYSIAGVNLVHFFLLSDL